MGPRGFPPARRRCSGRNGFRAGLRLSFPAEHPQPRLQDPLRGRSQSPPIAGGYEGGGSRILIAFRVLDQSSALCYRERMENEGQPNLGQYLRAMREANALSLRQVERKSGISNAFISQMESGKVKQPSPVKLYKLAELYGVPYDSLMELAGYPSPSGLPAEARSASTVFRRFGEITPAEETELLDYLSFLRSRARKGRRGA